MLWKCTSSFSICFSTFYVYSWKQCVILFFTKMALWQLMHLGTWSMITHCWYQWTKDDHFIYQGFPNSAKRWEVGISPLGQGNQIFLEIFFTGQWEPRRSDFDHSHLFQIIFFQQLHLKSKLAWPVYTKNMKLKQVFIGL